MSAVPSADLPRPPSPPSESVDVRDMNILRKERELAEREVELLRRKVEMMREMQRLSMGGQLLQNSASQVERHAPVVVNEAIDKGEVPLDTFHIDHLEFLPSTKKQYRYILIVVDAFSKFVWLYATKSCNSSEVIEHLRKQSILFGNPRRIISDRGTAFTSAAFEDYCRTEHSMC